MSKILSIAGSAEDRSVYMWGDTQPVYGFKKLNIYGQDIFVSSDNLFLIDDIMADIYAMQEGIARTCVYADTSRIDLAEAIEIDRSSPFLSLGRMETAGGVQWWSSRRSMFGQRMDARYFHNFGDMADDFYERLCWYFRDLKIRGMNHKKINARRTGPGLVFREFLFNEPHREKALGGVWYEREACN